MIYFVFVVIALLSVFFSVRDYRMQQLLLDTLARQRTEAFRREEWLIIAIMSGKPELAHALANPPVEPAPEDGIDKLAGFGTAGLRVKK